MRSTATPRPPARDVHDRRRPGAIAGMLVLCLALAACGQEGSSGTGPAGSTPAGAADTIASRMVLGAGPECPSPDRPYCLPGLRGTYGLEFKEFRPFDESGGSQTKTALAKGDIDIGLVFTSDGEIAANGWVLLEDDKKLQPSDNVTPVMNTAVAEAYGADLAKVVNDASAKITTADLVDLNKAVSADKKDADVVARDFVSSKGLAPSTPAAARTGTTIVVGSAAFTESEILANIYLEVLKGNGYPVESKFRIGSREVYFPALQRGEVTFLPEYAGTLLKYLDKSQNPSIDPAKTAESLTGALASQGLTALQPAPAEDKNGFVVTRATADRYKLVKLSDLAKPPPG
jgi:osmoprotectant transport system substrate-binding protein